MTSEELLGPLRMQFRRFEDLLWSSGTSLEAQGPPKSPEGLLGGPTISEKASRPPWRPKCSRTSLEAQGLPWSEALLGSPTLS